METNSIESGYNHLKHLFLPRQLLFHQCSSTYTFYIYIKIIIHFKLRASSKHSYLNHFHPPPPPSIISKTFSNEQQDRGRASFHRYRLRSKINTLIIPYTREQPLPPRRGQGYTRRTSINNQPRSTIDRFFPRESEEDSKERLGLSTLL